MTVEYRTLAAVSVANPLIEFLVPASSDSYLDLDDMYLHLKVTITAKKADDSAISAITTTKA